MKVSLPENTDCEAEAGISRARGKQTVRTGETPLVSVSLSQKERQGHTG